MKKVLVLLLCALAVFAIVSCKNDPKPEPTPETFKVTFDSQGGTEVAAATVEKDAKVEKPADPTKLGATFGGWFTEAACENEYNFDTAVTKDFTLYAKWTVVVPKFTVTFDTQGGSEIPAVEVEKDAKVTQPADPKKEGYAFGGWYTKAACAVEDEYDFDTAVTAAFTLYAKWIEVPAPTAAPAYYQLTATKANDNGFQMQWIFAEGSEVKPNDVISFKYKSAESFSKTVVRGMSAKNTATKKFTNGSALPTEPDADGWFTYSYTIPSKYVDDTDFTSCAGIGLALAYADKTQCAAGDIVYIKDLTYNGEALTLTTENRYYGVEITVDNIYNYYKFVGTKGTDGQDEHKYDWDKVSVQFASSVTVQPGDVLSFVFKLERPESTADREMSYSIRDPKKWFSEVKASSSSAKYPQWFSTFEVGEDGWIHATYVFPSVKQSSGEKKKTKEEITYPSTFRIDFRDSVFAVGETVIVKDLVLTSAGATTVLSVDEAKSAAAYAAPTISHL